MQHLIATRIQTRSILVLAFTKTKRELLRFWSALSKQSGCCWNPKTVSPILALMVYLNMPSLSGRRCLAVMLICRQWCALRVAGDFLKAKAGASRIWLSNPTWANHGAIFSAAGLATDSYRYLGECGKALDFTGMMESIAAIPAGDVICLHACCHNPTGVDPTVEQWSEIAAACATGGVLPLIDFAYQGFANGIREDAAALQPFLSSGNEFMVCSSFSKNFGLYAERVGALTIVSQDSDTAAITLSHAKTAVRTNYSNPPKHGGAIVATVLGSTELTALWESEVAAMRDRINGLRQEFVAAMVSRQCSVDFSFIQDQRGMFSFSGLNPLQVDQLRKEHSIYIVGSGRINVAGLNSSNIQVLCDAIIEVL